MYTGEIMTDFGQEFLDSIKGIVNISKRGNKQSIRSGGKSIIVDGDNVIINGKRIGIEDEHFVPKQEPKFKTREEYDAHVSDLKVAAQERVVENTLKLKALKSLTQEQLDKKFEEFVMDDYIASIFQEKVANWIKSKAYRMVSEALEDLDEDGRVLRPIRDSVIQKIKDAFKK